MPRYQPTFRLSSLLKKSVLRSVASAYLVRIYIGTALILPTLATSSMAQSSTLPNSATAQTTVNAVLVANNPRIDMLTQAIEQQPSNAALYNSRGWYSFLDGNYTQTVNDYGQVIELGIETIDPIYHTSVYHVRGLAYAELGETALAIENLQVAQAMYAVQDNTAGVQEIEAAIAQLSDHQ